MRVLLLVMLFAVYSVSFAQPVNPVADPGFEEADPVTGAPSGWFVPQNTRAKVRCKPSLTPSDDCALVIKGAGKVQQSIKREWNAGDTLHVNVTYRTAGPYVSGALRLDIAEVHYIVGSYVNAREARRKIKLLPSAAWTSLSSKSYKIRWDTFFDDPVGRNVVLNLIIVNRSAAGKLLVDKVELIIVPAETP